MNKKDHEKEFEELTEYFNTEEAMNEIFKALKELFNKE